MTASPGAPSAAIDNRAERTELILSQLEQLPTLPAVAIRVLRAANSSDGGASDLAALIQTDQALTSKVLSLVRRADLGVSRSVTTVSQAVVMLGFVAVRNAVLSVQVYEMFPAAESAEEGALDRTEFWKHSLAVACTAELIARRSGGDVRVDEAFVCGLLHDLGKVALDACLPKSYARIVRETRTRRTCICDAERAVLGLDHTVAGRRLGRRWKLPEPVVECLWLHHQPPDSLPPSVTGAKLVEIIHLADNIVRRQRIGYSGYNSVGDIESLGRRLGLDAEALADIAVEMGPLVEEHCELFGLGSLTSSELYARALADANDELGRLNVTLSEANRRLQMRSACFDALRGFHDSLGPEGTLLDVCHAAAVCTREALDLDGDAVCFLGNEAGTVYHACGSAKGEGGAVLAVDEPFAGVSARSADAILPAPEFSRPVGERFSAQLGEGAVWMLPAMNAGRLVGGALFRASLEAVDRLREYPDELDAVSGALGLAMVTASVRAGSEALVEELAHVNRKLHSAQEELLQTKSLGMIAAMAAGAAHELNNPLAVISGRAQLLAAGLQDEEQLQRLGMIRDHAQKASDIVTELVEFAKPDPPRFETVSLLPWFEDLRDRWIAESPLRPEQFNLSIADPGLVIRVDPEQLRRVFNALVANAVEATTSENARLDVNSTSRASDDTVVVSVEDNGCGMSSEVLDHALDPFFSHRPAGRGRGLGLSLAHRLAAWNGGRLWLESRSDVGTTAYVELPSARPG